MIETEPRFEYTYFLFLPKKISILTDKVLISVRLNCPDKTYLDKTYFNIILKNGQQEIYPQKTIKNGDKILFLFYVDSQGTYELIEKYVLMGFNVPELRLLAKKFQVSGRWGMSKEELATILDQEVGKLTIKEIKKMIKKLKK